LLLRSSGPDRLRGGSSAWSPVGDQIALQVFEGPDPNLWATSLWVADAPDAAAPWGLTARKVSDAGAYQPGSDSWANPRWSPDGTRIATQVQLAGSAAWDAVVVAADGSTDPAVVTKGPEDTGPPEWSPDGSRLGIEFQSGQGMAEADPYDLYLVKLDGSERTRVAAPPLSGWSGGLPFSPDGTRVAARSPDHASLIVITLDGSVEPVTIPTPFDSNPNPVSWQPVATPRFGEPAAP